MMRWQNARQIGRVRIQINSNDGRIQRPTITELDTRDEFAYIAVIDEIFNWNRTVDAMQIFTRWFLCKQASNLKANRKKLIAPAHWIKYLLEQDSRFSRLWVVFHFVLKVNKLGNKIYSNVSCCRTANQSNAWIMDLIDFNRNVFFRPVFAIYRYVSNHDWLAF